MEGWPRTVVQCHCGQCRRATGATPVAWAVFPRRALNLPRVRWYKMTPLSRRAFCPRCGTSLFFQHRQTRHEVDITVASFDQPERLPPQRLCFVPDRLGWTPLEEGLPRHQADTDSPLLLQPAAVPDWSELYRRALSQIALQAFPDPPRVQCLAEALLSASKYDLQRMREALAEYVQKYPDGASFLLEPLGSNPDPPL